MGTLKVNGNVLVTSPTMTMTSGLMPLQDGSAALFANGLAITNPAIKYDQGWLRMIGTGESDSVLELATGDDGTEPIVVRQYNTSSSIVHQITLLDANGNTETAGSITASSILGRTVQASLYKTDREIIAAPDGTAAGWYRCATLSSGKGSSNNFILSIRRSYYSPANEGYLFSISHDYTSVNISQLSGSTGGHLLTKIRVNFDENGNVHIDYYMNSNGVAHYKNSWYISGWGDGEVYTPYLVSSYTGSVTEFATVIGISNNNGFKGNADTASKLATARTISLTGSVTGSGTFDGSGNLSIATTTNHTHSYLPLAGGGTLTGSAVINFPAGSVSVAASTPMSLSYGRLACYGTLCINANTDNSGTEYIILTAGKGLSSSTTDGLAIGTSTLTWQGSTVLTTGNFPSSSSLARQTATWISAASLDVNTYYPVVIDIPYQGLCRIKLAVQLNSSTRPSWSTHNAGFTSNIDVEIIAAGWGTVSPFRYLLRQDDYSFSNVKPAYFAGQLSNASKAVFYVRGGGSYRFICDWQDASISLRTSSTTYNDQTVAPTTSTSIFHSGSKSHLYCNVDYASSAGNADTLDGSHASAFAAASHSHSYLPLSGGTMSGTITLANTGLRTPAESGYYTDQHGNFYHQNTAATSYWNIFNNAGTMSLQYYFETGVLHAPRPATSNYGGSLPSSGVTGEIFYKI